MSLDTSKISSLLLDRSQLTSFFEKYSESLQETLTFGTECEFILVDKASGRGVDRQTSQSIKTRLDKLFLQNKLSHRQTQYEFAAFQLEVSCNPYFLANWNQYQLDLELMYRLLGQSAEEHAATVHTKPTLDNSLYPIDSEGNPVCEHHDAVGEKIRTTIAHRDNHPEKTPSQYQEIFRRGAPTSLQTHIHIGDNQTTASLYILLHNALLQDYNASGRTDTKQYLVEVLGMDEQRHDDRYANVSSRYDVGELASGSIFVNDRFLRQKDVSTALTSNTRHAIELKQHPQATGDVVLTTEIRRQNSHYDAQSSLLATQQNIALMMRAHIMLDR